MNKTITETITKDSSGIEVLEEGSRSDLSWISTEAADRVGDVVIASGLVDDEYQRNPVVLVNHDTTQVAGTSAFRRVIPGRGVVAKTHYPPPPANHAGPWVPEQAWKMIGAGLMRAKSIRFQAIDHGPPTPAEKALYGESAKRIIRTWKLVEYSCVGIPCNPGTTTIQVSKTDTPTPPTPSPTGFVSLATAQEFFQKTLDGIDVAEIIRQALQPAAAPR